MWQYLLDTNTARLLARGANSALLRRARGFPRAHLVISSITEAEMRFGIDRLPPEARLRVTVPKFLESLESAPWDTLCARVYGQLAAAQQRLGKPLSQLDTLIAAHAVALNLTLVTNDQAFARVEGLIVEDWTQGSQHAMIAIIDYKAGNLTSVVKTLRYLGEQSGNPEDLVVTQNPADLRRASKIVLPGVGHFRSTELLHDLELTEATREAIAPGNHGGTPFLGICVGLQWLYGGSTEAETTDGLCHFGGRCEHFPTLDADGAPLKSPHVGWNSLESIRPDSRLLRGIAPGSFVYYTHSFRAPLSPDTAATTTYGTPFTAVVERDNVFGVQFHPEKSAETGLGILRNFLAL